MVKGSDLELKQLTVDARGSGQDQYFLTPGDVVGLEVVRGVLAGQPVLRKLVREPFLVRRGELIAAIANGGGIRVRTEVRAREDGAHGSIFQVETTDTKERFNAEVTGVRMVQVLGAGGLR